MKRPSRRSLVAGFALALALAACSSSPNPVLYTIAPVAGQQRNAGPKVVVLQQVGIERYLERSQIVRSSENYKLDVLANDWWGEPLGAMLGRVLSAELGQRLPGSTVINQGGVVTAEPDATVAVNIQRLDLDGTGTLILEAQVSAGFHGRGDPRLQSFRFAIQPPDATTAGEVAAISTAVGKLADGIADLVAAGPAS
jgi:uncharacterized lipoprotein YmbA